jgi:methylmalonyl-CoA mutase C-terminal domain/subunit
MRSMNDRIRIVIGKIGLDAHDRGVQLLLITFRDAGIEVVYAGKFLTPEQLVKIAIDEGADIIGLSDHTGAMLTIAIDMVEELKRKGVANSIAVIAGGIIPEEDKPALQEMGVTGLYGQGTPLSIIIDHVRQKGEENRRHKLLSGQLKRD